MAFDRQIFASRVKKLRETLSLSIEDVQQGTALDKQELEAYEKGIIDPKGDHVLILADFFRCDYRFLIDPSAPDDFDNTAILFRAHSNDLSKADRLAIQETLFLCENEEFLQRDLDKKTLHFGFVLKGSFFKGQGQEAATELRRFLQYKPNELKLDVFSDLRKIGLHVFRRRLNNPEISGLFISHPSAGRCIIVNYDEDVFRQRFTAAHECGHAILDQDTTFNMSFPWRDKDLREVRANAFASFLLIPPDFARNLPNPQEWNQAEIITWASKMKLSTRALAIGLREHDLIDAKQYGMISATRVPAASKSDPELPDTLSRAAVSAKRQAMERGLSSYYVGLVFDAYKQGLISRGRLAEMLLCAERDVEPLAELFGRSLNHED